MTTASLHLGPAAAVLRTLSETHDDTAFAVDLADDRGTVLVCGLNGLGETLLVQEALRRAGHTVVASDELDRRGELIESLWEHGRHQVYVCEPPPRLSDCLKFRDPDFKPLRNRIQPRRVLEPVTAEDHAAVAAARDRQARRNAKRAAPPSAAAPATGDRA